MHTFINSKSIKITLFIMAMFSFSTFSYSQSPNLADIEKFIFLNSSLEHAIFAMKYASESAYKQLKEKVEKAGNTPEGLATLQKSEDLKHQVTKTFKAIENIKMVLHHETGGGIDPATGLPKNLTEVKKVANLMISNGKQGYKLKKALDEYVDYLNTQFVKDKLLGFSESFAFSSLARDNKEHFLYKNEPTERDKDFATANFSNASVMAAIAMLTQKQSEIIIYEQEVLKKLGVDEAAQTVNFDRIIIGASANSDMILAGQEYKAQMFIAKIATDTKTKMSYNGSPVRVNENGVGEVKFIATGMGRQKWRGIIASNFGGKDTAFVVEKEYEVVAPQLIVKSLTTIVLYKNCANELATSVPSLGSSYRPAFSVDNGRAIPRERLGEVSLYPTQLGICKLAISHGGRNMGTETFNVIPIPPPTISLGNEKSTEINLKDPVGAVNQLKVIITPDQVFMNTLPKEANYRVMKIGYTIFRNGAKIAEGKNDNGDVNLATLNTKPGDAVQIKVEKVQRVNSFGQTEDVEISQPYIGFLLK